MPDLSLSDVDTDGLKLVASVAGTLAAALAGKAIGSKMSGTEAKLWARLDALDVRMVACHDQHAVTKEALLHCEEIHRSLAAELDRRSATSKAEQDELNARLEQAGGAIIELRERLGNPSDMQERRRQWDPPNLPQEQP